MSAGTGELRALREQVAAQQEAMTALIRTIEHLAEGLDLQPEAPGPVRPQLRVIRGGKR